MKKSVISILMIALIACSCKNNDKESNNGNNAGDEKAALIAHLKQQVAQHADSSSLRMQFVNTLDSLGMYKEAMNETDSLIQRDSTNNGLWFTRGHLLESSGDTISAINSYRHAIAIYPSVEAQLSLANLYAEIKNPRCLQICSDIIRMGLGRETDASCNFINGVYYARIHSAAEALSYFDRCINDSYTYMVAYMEKGFIYYEQKKYAEALGIFKTAVTVNNTYADAYYWQAKCYEATGNKQEAVLNYERSLGLDKNMVEAREAIRRIK